MTVTSSISLDREFHYFIPTSELTLGIVRTRRMTVENIKIAVADYYGLSLDEMTRHTNRPVHSHPRMLAMYMARSLTPMSYPEIGRRFGNRDHTTVLHAFKVVQKRIRDDDHTARDLTAIRAGLASWRASSLELQPERGR